MSKAADLIRKINEASLFDESMEKRISKPYKVVNFTGHVVSEHKYRVYAKNDMNDRYSKSKEHHKVQHHSTVKGNLVVRELDSTHE